MTVMASPTNETLPPLSWSIFQQHGLFKWCDAERTLREEDIVIPPLAILDTSADLMWAAIDKSHGPQLQTMLVSAKHSALVINTDAISGNRKVVKYMSLKLKRPILWVKCMQHQCALILGLMANYLGFVGALYCTCKQLRSGEHLARLEKCIRHIIDS